MVNSINAGRDPAPPSQLRMRAGWRMALVLGAGIAIAWIDTRPNWDDTGITALGILVLAASGSLLGVAPWLSALLAAGPIVVTEISGGQDVLAALLFALAGACAGSLARGWTRKH